MVKDEYFGFHLPSECATPDEHNGKEVKEVMENLDCSGEMRNLNHEGWLLRKFSILHS